ncbi:MAG: lamin tail domain-containing protein [Chloroflexi bacterium]|nr:lamin tail domain-containing protein [Chloroflexota bacterium]
MRKVRPSTRRALVSSLIAVPALVVVTACAGSPPAAPSQPTVQAATTQVVAAASPAAATVQAAASPAAATVQAAASPAMATAQAAASPMATQGAAVVATAAAGLAPMASPSPGASPAAQGNGALRIADASLADSTPWLMLQNAGDEPVAVGGWTLQVGAAHAELPTDAVVEPGATLTLHAGAGLSSDDELFLGNAGDALAAAALPGTPVRLMDANGRLQAETTVPRF